MKSLIALISAVMLIAFAAQSLAVEVPFNQVQFDSMIAAGKPVAVVFHADWCPTCRAQAPLLKELTQTPELKGLTLFVANAGGCPAARRSSRAARPRCIAPIPCACENPTWRKSNLRVSRSS